MSQHNTAARLNWFGLVTLVLDSLRYYWRSHLAIAGGIAIAVAVLSGALLVGESVRASLRSLLDGRLGHVSTVAAGTQFFREALAGETGSVPIIVLGASATNPENGRRAGAVTVYGVDDRFWKFQGWNAPSGIAITPALRRKLGPGEVLLRMDKPSAIPKESLHGRKDEGRTLRAAPEVAAYEFSIQAQQGDVLAAYVPLRRLQRELGQNGRVNTLLFAGAAPDVTGRVTLDDLGIRLRTLDTGGVSIERDAAIVNDALARAAGENARSVFSYLANSIRTGERAIPYSLVSAVDPGLMKIAPGEIVLNEWAAAELIARAGDVATLEYYVWSESGTLLTRTAAFRVARVVPISGFAADRQLAPEYPGITEAKNLHDWDPPFPMDLSRIRPADEAYWTHYRTTPKAFLAFADGEKLWASRFGRRTSMRAEQVDAQTLRSRINPADFGFNVLPVRSNGFEASRGSTDFGEYFTYFSFFLVASAALLAALFFRLNVEQRSRQTGTLLAMGWPLSKVRRLWLLEGSALALAGAILGTAGSIGYCALVLYGLRTWWRGAVGTSALGLVVDPASLLTGAFAGMFLGVAVIWWVLRSASRTPARMLIAGASTAARAERPRRRWVIVVLLAGAGAMIVAGSTHAISAAEAFFGAALLLLAATLMAVSVWLRSARGGLESSPTLWTLGANSARYRPGRSVLSIALIASAVFLLVSLDTFRQHPEAQGPKSGTGGFALMAESQLPILWDLNSAEGRENTGLPALNGVRFFQLRLRPGEDASCLNLYAPRNPRVLGAPQSLLDADRFSFSGGADGWKLLNQDLGGVVPAIADANSITYVLHKKVGEEIEVGGKRLRLVAALSGSFLQSELIVSEQNFVRLFPEEQGYRYFLIDAPSAATGEALEDALRDYGFETSAAAERLASYQQVENTYLSTFQALGALGLLLGTAGLAAVLLRNVLERRRELALLGALGLNRDQISLVVLAENAFLVACGLFAGACCALLAVIPAAIERGGGVPLKALLLLSAAVPLTAAVSSILAVRVVRKAPMLESLRFE